MVQGGLAQSECNRTVTVVEEEPVVGPLTVLRERDTDRFMPRAGDLEEDLVLPLEGDLAIIEVARGHHRSVEAQELLC